MSIFRDYNFGYNQKDREREERMLELRRAASRNLTQVYAGKFRKDPKPKKRSELEDATADDIARGEMVVEMRELSRIELRYASRKHLSDDDRAHWEEVDARLDTLRCELQHYTRTELNRFHRLWSKSRKVKYHVHQ